MKTYSCQCGNTLHFENSLCLSCGRAVGFLTDALCVAGLDDDGGHILRDPGSGARYRRCRNFEGDAVCNWLVPAASDQTYCQACRLNLIIPNLDDARNRVLWSRVEAAKRRLLYGLLDLRLPVIDRVQDPDRGLGFELVASRDSDEYANPLPPRGALTGHRTGVITIDVKEADDSTREQVREQMNERYRTLLGHFRHESGHYYWDYLIGRGDRIGAFRSLFGDERRDYAQALGLYYGDGPPAGWEESYVTRYASAHPWEDWAETWAHYLHMVDTLETAHDQGVSAHGRRLYSLQTAAQAVAGPDPRGVFDALIADWGALSITLNALNRSMGLPDACPFAPSGAVLEKLYFVHAVVDGKAPSADHFPRPGGGRG